MCGITGFFHAPRPADTFPATVSRMLGMIRHRGPDEMGYFFDTQVALGAARLRILDLQHGQQPLADASGRYLIVYNGEVYNYLELRHELVQHGYPFRTQSDTEVVLAAYVVWGSAAFPRFNGGFACAIYDRDEACLLLVRDRYGKRPLFYTRVGDEWLFASELKCFLAHGGVTLRFDPAQIASIFALWTPLPHQSGYEGIAQLPAGAFLYLRRQVPTPEPVFYERLDIQADPAILAHMPSSLAGAAEETRARLHESVRLRLRSDVAVGTYLSGGLDSAITTLLAVQHATQPVRSFSISFSEPQFDESHEQQLVSGYLGTHHTTLQLTHRALVEAFPQALWHAEVPVFRSALVPMYLLAQRVRAAGITVVLTGEGADETFLGYDLFKETLVRQEWAQLRTPEEKQGRIRQLYPYLSQFQQHAATLAGVFEQFAQERTAGLFSHEVRFQTSRFGLRLLRGEYGDGLAALQQLLASRADEVAGHTPLQRAQWLEFTTLLGGYLLSSQGDRMSFAHGVETRMPFLDPQVVRWAWSMPTAWKLSPHGQEKRILKEAFAGMLPTAILERAKQPYRAPDAAPFLGAEAPDYLELLLSARELQRLELIDDTVAIPFVQKLRRTAPERISQRENQAFLFLLSLALLQYQLVEGRGAAGVTGQIGDWAPAAIAGLLVRRIDGRAMGRGGGREEAGRTTGYP